MESADIHGTVAKEGHGHLIRAAQPDRPRGACCHRKPRPDDGKRPQRATAGIREMHGAAQATAKSIAAAHDLGQRPCRIGPFCQHLAVAAIRARHIVVPAQSRADADCHRLLPLAEVGGAGDVSLREKILHPVLEGPDQPHDAVCSQKVQAVCCAHGVYVVLGESSLAVQLSLWSKIIASSSKIRFWNRLQES